MTHKIFRRKLTEWYPQNARDLPWVKEKDPYKIWLCEVIMQQTQVHQGIAYYNRFIQEFPTVQKLAKAPEHKVLKMWEGLGYYSRARSLHESAKTITEKYNGNFPDQYAELIQLKGIGPYIASAILSFTWNRPYIVADANVNRIIARCFGVETEMQSALFQQEVKGHLQKCFDKNDPAAFNQAIMDFGSLVCKPKNPDCENCPMARTCFAKTHDMQTILPVKARRAKRKVRYFNYLVFAHQHKTIIEQRNKKDIWKNLFQFPLIESKRKSDWKSLKAEIESIVGVNNLNGPHQKIEVKPQLLTHQEIHAVFYLIPVKDLSDLNLSGTKTVKHTRLKKYAFPGIIRNFFNELK